jgi:hypothetical protein
VYKLVEMEASAAILESGARKNEQAFTLHEATKCE